MDFAMLIASGRPRPVSELVSSSSGMSYPVTIIIAKSILVSSDDIHDAIYALVHDDCKQMLTSHILEGPVKSTNQSCKITQPCDK